MKEQLKEEIGELKDGKRITGFWALVNLVGGVSGLLSLLMVAVLAGGLKRQVEINTKRLDVIEQAGSPTLQSAVKALQLEIEARKESDSQAHKRVDDLRTDFFDRTRVISELLQRQIEQQTALIAFLKAQNQIK